jgi:REP element-mobilizing transposase RayT
MARQWRIEYPNAFYHVFSRGNGHQNIFLSDSDRFVFLDLLKELSERFNINIHVYVLMENHYHLLIKTPEANLSKAMQWFGTTYTRRFNLHNDRDGHLFQGRFKSIIVENDAYLLNLSYYIHRNPLRAGLVDRLVDFKWSSYSCYAYGKNVPLWLKTSLILDQIGGEEKNKSYREKVQQYADESGSVWENVKHGLVYGSEDFLEDLKERFLSKEKDAELPQHNRMFRDIDPHKILQKASKVLHIDLETVYRSRRVSQKDKDHRDFLIYLLWESGRFNNQQIASFLGISYSNVSKRITQLRTRFDEDKKLRGKYQALNAQIKV